MKKNKEKKSQDMKIKICISLFSQGPYAKQGDVVKVPRLIIRGREPLKVGEVSLTELRPDWRQVLSSCTVQLCTVVKMICT